MIFFLQLDSVQDWYPDSGMYMKAKYLSSIVVKGDAVNIIGPWRSSGYI